MMRFLLLVLTLTACAPDAKSAKTAPDAGGDPPANCPSEVVAMPTAPACAKATQTCLAACADGDDTCSDKCMMAGPRGCAEAMAVSRKCGWYRGPLF